MSRCIARARAAALVPPSTYIKNNRIQHMLRIGSDQIFTGLLLGALMCCPEVSCASETALGQNNQKPPAKTYLQVLASVGPLHYLSGATVQAKNARGKIVGRGKTNTRGSVLFELNPNFMESLPLTIVSNGGKKIYSTGDQYNGPRFDGHLRGKVVDIRAGEHAVFNLDTLTTVSSLLARKGKAVGYTSALSKVRSAFGITSGAPDGIIRFTNQHIDAQLLDKETSGKLGYDRYVKALAIRIKNGESIAELRPSRQGVAKSVGIMKANTSLGSFPVCNVPLGNGTPSTGDSSTEVIGNAGVIAIEALAAVAGFASIGEAAGSILGNLLEAGPSGSGPTIASLNAVDTQLNCISSQLNYLNEQIDLLQFSVDVSVASNCSNSINNAFYQYTGLIQGAMPNSDGSPSSSPMNSTNASFVQDVKGWGTLENQGCGSAINTALFGSGGGLGAAWQQLNTNYQSKLQWYTQPYVQQLQQFLSYWSGMLSQAFILTNEYYNYMGQQENALINSGGVQSSPGVCSSASAGGFCVWANNIASAYPGDLYSDEIGMYNNGISVSAIPAGVAFPLVSTSASPPGLAYDACNAWNYYVESGQPGGVSLPAAAAFSAAYSYSNSLYSAGASSAAVETFMTPLANKNQQVSSSDLGALQNTGPNGLSAYQFFYNEINNDSTAPWASIRSSSVTYYSSDSTSSVGPIEFTKLFMTTNPAAAFGARGSYSYPVVPMLKPVACPGLPNSFVPNDVVFGVLLGRTWWPGAITATIYTPPPAPTQ